MTPAAALAARLAPLRLAWGALPGALRGAVLLIVSFFFFTFEIVGAKMLGDRLPTAQVTFVRSFGQLVVLAPFIAMAGGAMFRWKLAHLHLLRSTLGIAGLYAYFYSFGHMPLAAATTLSFTKALFLVFLAWAILREQVGPRRWSATLAGLVGVLIVVRPGADSFEWVSLIAVFSAICGAGLMVTTKFLTGRESTLSIMCWVAVITTVYSVGPGLWFWQAPDAFELKWLAIIGLFGPIGQFFGISAFRAADASFLAPIDYLRLLISVGAGFWLFAERPDVYTALGAAVIVGSTLYVNHREMRVARARARAARVPPPGPPLQ